MIPDDVTADEIGQIALGLVRKAMAAEDPDVRKLWLSFAMVCGAYASGEMARLFSYLEEHAIEWLADKCIALDERPTI